MTDTPADARPKLPGYVRRLFLLEQVALGFLALSAATALVADLPFFLPDSSSFASGSNVYLGPITLGCVLAAVAGLIRQARSGTEPSRQLGVFLRLTAATLLIGSLHFNWKIWALMLNPVRFDAAYHSADMLFRPIEPVLLLVRQMLFSRFAFLTHDPYHDILIGMFFLSLAAYALSLRPVGLYHMVTAATVVLVIGGIAYAIAPAYGPFIFGPGIDPETTRLQASMLAFSKSIVASAGRDYNPAFFVSALAAMPSLHVAHGAVFVWYAFRLNRWFGMLQLVPFAYFCSEAVLLRWHYWVDLPAGLLVAVLAIAFTARFAVAEARPQAPVRERKPDFLLAGT